MGLYAIGLIIHFFVCFLSVTLETVSISGFEYGNIDGVGSVYDESGKVDFCLTELGDGESGGTIAFLFILFFIILLLFSLGNKFLKEKVSSKIHNFFICVLSFVPFFMTVFGASASEDREYIGGGGAVYGSGTIASVNGTGYFLLILAIIGCVCLIKGRAKFVGEEE